MPPKHDEPKIEEAPAAPVEVVEQPAAEVTEAAQVTDEAPPITHSDDPEVAKRKGGGVIFDETPQALQDSVHINMAAISAAVRRKGL